eukprot:9378506-Heterocapsa_arctica.AAC.1
MLPAIRSSRGWRAGPAGPMLSLAGPWSRSRPGSLHPAAQAQPRPLLSSGTGSKPHQPTCRSPLVDLPAELPH